MKWESNFTFPLIWLTQYTTLLKNFLLKVTNIPHEISSTSLSFFPMGSKSRTFYKIWMTEIF